MKATQECSIEGCERRAKGRGWCGTHYERWRHRGTTDPYTPADRLADGLILQPNGCLEWTGLTNDFGYGLIGSGISGKGIRTHRLAWTTVNGPIPDGLLVLHHCDNPPCCQMSPTPGFPDGHLFLGTKLDNNRDMAAKGRGYWQRKTHCPQGHPYDEVNTYVIPSRPTARYCWTCKRERRQKQGQR
jgi:hypothetical protein